MIVLSILTFIILGIALAVIVAEVLRENGYPVLAWFVRIMGILYAVYMVSLL